MHESEFFQQLRGGRQIVMHRLLAIAKLFSSDQDQFDSQPVVAINVDNVSKAGLS